MGMNYFAQVRRCPNCGTSAETVHIGKSSAGRKFLFRADLGRRLADTPQWEAFLARDDVSIFDENDRMVDKSSFWAIVESKQHGLSSDHDKDGGGWFVDHEGNEFTTDCFR